ncbi:hypothetical protein BDV25DRAFT_135813 [Aspergillus avenaceus]|uniref:NACHT domain-containing protein n=1 Tax=Aspergillus avenaceus TaxID=36643 RepID=A0A5N6U7R9_ASPAV|nr:hypothetical protein BDV25DRAFT_135813 [Aspergillus avenaceus]
MSAKVAQHAAGFPSFREDIFQQNGHPGTAVENGATVESPRKPRALRETTDRISSRLRPQLDGESREIFDSIHSAADVFDDIAVERLRFMPEDGSQLDRAFKEAVVLVGRLDQLAKLIESFSSATEQAVRLMGGSCILLLQCGIDQAKLLISVFKTFHAYTIELSHVRNNSEILLSDAGAQEELVAAYSELCELICSVCLHYFSKAQGSSRRIEPVDLQSRFHSRIQAFNSHRIALKERVWSSLILPDVSADPLDKVQEIWEYLSVKDQTVPSILAARTPQPAELTCEWFSNRFYQIKSSDSRLFAVTGDVGSGKTVLSQWIVDQLQASIDPEDYGVVSFRLYDDISATTGPIGVAKGLLLEALSRQAKDGNLLRALEESMRLHRTGASSKAVEDSLWQALNIAVTDAGKVIIIIDGVDNLNGDPEVIPRLFEHLQSLVSNAPTIKVIVLSRYLHAMPKLVNQIKIDPTQTAKDIRTVVRAALKSSDVCIGMRHEDQAKVENAIVKKANGCFITAQLAVAQLSTLRSPADMLTLVQKMPSSLQDVLKQSFKSVDLGDPTARSVLSWSLASHRPLRIEEVHCLLETDTKRAEVVPRVGNVVDDIKRALGSFVLVEDGVVSLRSSALRQFITNQAKSATNSGNKGLFPFTLKECHHDLLTRLLAYVKLGVMDEADVSTTALNGSSQSRYFDQYPLLEYAARYWTLHFRSSQMTEREKDNFKVTNLFKRSFPDSVLFALLEGSCHQIQYLPHQAQELQMFSVQLRRQILHDLSLPLLQSLITAAQISSELNAPNAIGYSYEAWRKSNTLLGRNSSITKAVAELFINSSQRKDNGDPTFLSQRQEVLEYLVQLSKEELGPSHESTLQYTQMLFNHYIAMKEKGSAGRLSRELFEIVVAKYGQYSANADAFTKHIHKQLERLSMADVSADITESQYEYSKRNLPITDQRIIDSTLHMVSIYEKHGDNSKADNLFMDTWRRLLAVEGASDSVLKKQAEFTLKYSEYLNRRSRNDEAESVINAVWFSLEGHLSHYDELSSTFEMTINHIRKMEWTGLAHSALGTLWEYRKSQKQVPRRLMKATASLAQTVQESRSVTEANMSHEQIGMLHEVLESAASSGMASAETTLASMKTSEKVAAKFVERGQWPEAAHVYRQALIHIWPDIDSKTSTFRLTENVEETIHLALNLAECYFKDLDLEKATYVYQNTLKAVLTSDAADTRMVRSTAEKIISFYRATYRFLDAIATYRELYRCLSSRLGKTHKESIGILYAWGDFAKKRHKPAEAEEAYKDIYNHLRHNNQLDSRAISAARSLVAIFEETERWENAKEVYETLWLSIAGGDKDHLLESGLAEDVYQRYQSLLETKVDVDITEKHDLAASYRTTCQRLHGTSSRQFYDATFALASISRKDQRYHGEAVSLYEMLLDRGDALSGQQSTASTKHYLADLYSRQSQTGHKATALYREQYQSSIHEHGHGSHNHTLPRLRVLLESLQKQNNKAANTELRKALQSATIAAFEERADGQRLYSSAIALAQMHIDFGVKDSGIQLSKRLHHRLIQEAVEMKGSHRATSFVVAFQMALSNNRNYASIMADLIAEIQLYSAFHRTSGPKSFIHTFIDGVRLMNFQSGKGLTEDAHLTDTELFKLFTERCSDVEPSKATLREFYDTCISQATQGDLVKRLCRVIVDNVYQKLGTGYFRHAYGLAAILQQFIKDSGGFQDLTSTKDGAKLSSHLMVYGAQKCSDQNMSGKMLELSKSILHEILSTYQTKGISLTEFEDIELNQLAILLGGQRNFGDLEFLLGQLWSSRVVQRTWSSDTIILVGRRLVEARFSNGRTAQAIHLCGDLCYNVKRVWGQFDKSALELTNLLSALYTAENDHARAMGVHESVLRQLLEDGTDLPMSRRAEIANGQAARLQRCYQRNGGWNKGSERYEHMFRQLNDKFAKETQWTSRNPKQWKAKDVDQLGRWEPPSDYGFLTSSKGTEHHNQLRKASEPHVEPFRGEQHERVEQSV